MSVVLGVGSSGIFDVWIVLFFMYKMWLAVYCTIVFFLCVFFFKQKTAYEMRISDWSSDVCSSDLNPVIPYPLQVQGLPVLPRSGYHQVSAELKIEIGRASCRERVCQYV